MRRRAQIACVDERDVSERRRYWKLLIALIAYTGSQLSTRLGQSQTYQIWRQRLHGNWLEVPLEASRFAEIVLDGLEPVVDWMVRLGDCERASHRLSSSG